MSFKYNRLKEAELKAMKKRNGNFDRSNESSLQREEVTSSNIKFRLNIFLIILLVIAFFLIAAICKFMNNKFIVMPINSKIMQKHNETASTNKNDSRSTVNESNKKKRVEIFEENKQTLKIKSDETINWQQIDSQTLKVSFKPSMEVIFPDSKNIDFQFADADNQIVITIQNQRSIHQILEDSPYDLRILLINNTSNMEKISIPLTKEERRLLESQKIANLLDNQKIEEAITALYQFIAEYPNEKEEREELIELLLKTGNLLKANYILNEGLKIFPKDLNLNKLKVQWYLVKGEQKFALQHLKELSKHKDCDQEILALLASVAYQNEEYELAEKNYRSLLDQDVNNLAWWIGLGLSLDMQGKEQAAKSVYQKIDTEGLDNEIRKFINSKLGK